MFAKAREHRHTEKNDISKRRQEDLTTLAREMTKVEDAIINTNSIEMRTKFEDKRQALNTRKMDLQKVIDEDSINPDNFKRLLEKSKLLFLGPEIILTEPDLELRQVLLGVQTADHILWR